MDKKILQLNKDINKMLSDLEYDKFENNRLRLDIDHVLDIDTISCDKKTLIDRLVYLYLLHSQTSSKKFRKNKFKHIRKAIKLNDNEYLYNAVYNTTSIFELRQHTADNRYELRELLNTPSSCLAVGTIVDEFHFIETQWKDLKDIAEEIKDYISNIYTINNSMST